ncbi:HD-GYP domain-containing protein [Pseudothauera rhizosphaerae]|uniref:HD domain-containing protein n=1 Tax=Pseudothauera rhizosphaerae TaxID=2565932 RepID=A0A4S4ATR2_9RHOO|nr:HD domain-containing phosphohydrolase [Pseudothauera rhizosphaerae]THF63317.1 HD domain-containing protein [Pseudothauera rhizosphaerae]
MTAVPVRSDRQIADAFLAATLPARLVDLRVQIGSVLPDVVRVGIFLVDDEQARLTHWADSEGRVRPCPPGVASLPDNPALSRCGALGCAQTPFVRLDPALEWAADGRTCPLVVLPVSRLRRFYGFLVVEADPAVVLPTWDVRQLLTWGRIATGLLAQGIEAIHALIGATRFALDFTLMRDRETGEHQLRLRDYIRVLTEELSAAHGLSDEFIAELTLFGPLHDIGKVGIPDAILLKPGRFERDEWEHMKEHVIMGRRMVERLVDNFDLQDIPGIRTLHAVVAHHHERLDGSGYPEGIHGDAIPLAARIVSTADIFDALTCLRSYKRPWSLDDAFAQIEALAGDKLDLECVRAMVCARPRIEAVWRRHACAPAAD